MPKLKKPTSLQKLAFDFLVEHAVRHCDSISNKGCLISELRQSITVIRQYLSEVMPGTLFANFCTQFLEEFLSIMHPFRGRCPRNRPIGHQEAALEIMMDVEIVGLTCGGFSAFYLDPSHAHRFKGLKVLDWGILKSGHLVEMGLRNYRLQDLTTFIYPNHCTDFDLWIIGSRCLKLEILNISGSVRVTDDGLRELRLCSELQFCDLRYCKVSNDGLNELLDFHKKLAKFNAGDTLGDGFKNFDVLSRPISSACPSMKRFTLKCHEEANARLRSVVILFPNLTYIGFRCPSVVFDQGDLDILKDLKNLTEIEFLSGGFNMTDIKELLSGVGDNITRLTLRWEYIYTTQEDLNFIYEVCSNLERLNINYKPIETDNLIIPPFRKLKFLEFITNNWNYDIYVKFEFCEMLSLEVLSFAGYADVYDMIESIIRDHVRFPNLRKVRKNYQSVGKEFMDRLKSIPIKENLDISLDLESCFTLIEDPLNFQQAF